MKLYQIAISPCCRVVWLYCLQNNLDVELIDVDVLEGEHKSPEFLKLSPHSELPVLVDDHVTVFDPVAILRYLAFKYTNHSGFGKILADRMKVQSTLEWASTCLHGVVGYKVVYPQFLERYNLSEEAIEALIDKGTVDLTRHLETLERSLIQDGTAFLCGNEPKIADFYVATILAQLEWIDFDLSLWPGVTEWLKRTKGACNHWEQVHKKHCGFVEKLKDG